MKPNKTSCFLKISIFTLYIKTIAIKLRIQNMPWLITDLKELASLPGMMISNEKNAKKIGSSKF